MTHIEREIFIKKLIQQKEKEKSDMDEAHEKAKQASKSKRK